MDKDFKLTYIVVLNYNGFDDTVECIESLLKIEDEFKIVVVDNSESEDDFNKFKARFPKFRFFYEKHYERVSDRVVFIKSLKNGGFSAGNNIGIRYAFFCGDFKYIWVLNNDTVVDKNALKFLKEKIEKVDKKVGFLGNKLLYYNSNTIQAIGGKYNKFIAQAVGVGAFEEDKGQYDREDIRKIVDYPVGASMFFKKEFLEEVGLFNETYFLYFEEMDYVIRAKNMGWDFDICYKAKVWHKEGKSTREHLFLRSEFSDLINLKNRIIFTKRYFPCYLPFVYLSFVPVIMNRIKRKRFKVIKEIVKFMIGIK